MNEIVIKENVIQNMIYEVRGVQVMLDSDLAKLYGVETKRINEAVKNNPDKFPERLTFKLNKKESDFLVEIFDQKKETRGGRYKNPRVFVEQGVYMLATVLKSSKATKITLDIMDAFVAMRHFIGNNLIEQNNINNMVIKHDNDIKLLQDTFNKFIKPEEKNKIFFDGQVYDAYSLLLDILDKSQEEIIIIDNYADKKLLDLLSKTSKKVKVYSKNITEELIKKYNKQYNNVELINEDIFHDRFIIIDKSILYSVGASFKDLGNKCFSINKIEDKNIINNILDRLK